MWVGGWLMLHITVRRLMVAVLVFSFEPPCPRINQYTLFVVCTAPHTGDYCVLHSSGRSMAPSSASEAAVRSVESPVLWA